MISPNRIFPLPFIFRGKRLFSVPLHLAVHEPPLHDVVGVEAGEQPALPIPAGADGLLQRYVADPGWRTHTVRDDRIAYVLLRDVWHYLVWPGYERFLEGRYSAKTRESFVREEARFVAEFGSDGRLDLRSYRSPAEIAEFLGHVEAVRVLGGISGCTLPDGNLGESAAGGDVNGFVLFAGSAPVAYVCLQADGQTLQYVCAGERDDFRSWSAGAILHLQAFQRIFADPRFRYVDFRPGESEVKRQFANGALRSATVLNLRLTLRNRLLMAVYGLLMRGVAAGSASGSSVPDEIRAQLAGLG